MAGRLWTREAYSSRSASLPLLTRSSGRKKGALTQGTTTAPAPPPRGLNAHRLAVARGASRLSLGAAGCGDTGACQSTRWRWGQTSLAGLMGSHGEIPTPECSDPRCHAGPFPKGHPQLLARLVSLLSSL